MHAADLESQFAEYDGYTAEARAGELLLGVGIRTEQHDGPMSAVAPGWKLRVLLAQALFADPDILLLDEPTNNLDINTHPLAGRRAQRAHEHHGHHLARPPLPQQRVHAHGGPGLRHAPRLSRQLRRLHDRLDAGARSSCCRTTPRPRTASPSCRTSSAASRANKSKARQATSRARQIEKIKRRGREALQPPEPVHPLRRRRRRRSCTATRWRSMGSPRAGRAVGELFAGLSLNLEAGARLAIIGPNGVGKTTLLRTLLGELAPDAGTRAVGGEGDHRLLPAGPDRPTSTATHRSPTGCGSGRRRATTSRSCARRWAGCCSPATTARSRSGCCRAARRARMLFGKLMLQRPNVLVLDEPTNHLDMESIESLQHRARATTPGTLIFVSHDRAVRLVAGHARSSSSAAPTAVHFHGSYEDYLASRGHRLTGPPGAGLLQKAHGGCRAWPAARRTLAGRLCQRYSGRSRRPVPRPPDPQPS